MTEALAFSTLSSVKVVRDCQVMENPKLQQLVRLLKLMRVAGEGDPLMKCFSLESDPLLRI